MQIKAWCKAILFLFFTGIPEVYVFAQLTNISRDWKFKTGDSLEWSYPNYNDAHWNDIKAGLWWAHAGYDYSGFAWYRKKIFISSELKNAVEKLGYLKLNLGQIQDVDQTFLNGKLIGQTGSFSPFEGKWGQPRIYFVKADQIHWDAENTIAVRVYGPNNNGGMHTGPYTYEPYRITFSDYVTIRDSHIQPAETSDKDKYKFTIVFHNSANQNYKGELLFQVIDSSITIPQSQKQKITIHKNADSCNIFSFLYVRPRSDIYRISAVFTESKTKGQITKEIIISSLTKVFLPVCRQPSAVIENKIKDAFIPAPFENQKIGGLIGGRLDINLNKRLLEVDEKELLAGYLNRPGNQNWVGEHIGKYLEAACNTWRYTHDLRLKAQMDRMLFVLLHTQKENGYLGTYTPDAYWTNWDVWSHKYNLVGLLAYYETTGYAPALQAAKRIGDLLCKTFGDNPGQMDIVTSGTHVGMASTSVLDPMVDLYRFSGDTKYLNFSNYIIRSYNHPDGSGIIKTLLEKGQVNQVANGKAYEMLSNLVGIIKLYKVTGDEELYRVVKIAWNDIVENRLYITGTASSNEFFSDDHLLPAGVNNHMGEGCVTTTWLQLNYQLYTLTGDCKYYDQLEKTVYNHLLGAENPQNGCVSYYTPLQGKKSYSCDITCCLSSIPRGISMIPLINYGKYSGVPTLLLPESEKIVDTIFSNTNQIIPVAINSESSFPDTGNIIYTISLSEEAIFTIAFRVPTWSVHYTAMIDDKLYKGLPGQYLTIKKKWKPDEKIKIHFDIPVIILTGGISYPDRIAIQRGPQVLALDQSLNQFIQTDSLLIRNISTNSLILSNAAKNLPENWIGKQGYAMKAQDYQGQSKDIILVPFSDASQTGENALVWIKGIYNK